MFEVFSNTYRITAVMKVETNINTSIHILASPLARAVIQVKMYAETFKNDVIFL